MTMPAEAPAPEAPPPPTESALVDEIPAEGEGEVPPAAASGEQVSEPEKPAEPPPERETALFRKALRMREQGMAERKKAEDVLSSVRKEREQLQAERQQLRDLRKVHEAIEADPMAYFEHFNINPADFARKMMNLQDPVRADVEQVRRENAAIKAELERERQERADRELQSKVGHAKTNFVRFVQNADDYPDIADEDEGELAEVFWELASEHHRNTGKVPTFEMVAAHLQQQAEAKRARREQRRQQRGASTSANQAAPQRTAQTGRTANGPGQRAPDTLTNADTTTRTTAPSDNATEEEINEWAAQELRKAFRKDADS